MSRDTIKASNKTIAVTVDQELDLYGDKADLNHIDVSGVVQNNRMFEKCKIKEEHRPKFKDEEGI